MTSEKQKIIEGEASETDEESEIHSGKLKESIEQALNSNQLVQSLVIQGEASESDEELHRLPSQKPDEKSEPSNESQNRNKSDNILMRDLEEDVTNSLKWLIQDNVEITLDELSNCNQLLLSTQVILQKDNSAIKQAANNLENISTRLDDILSFNFIPKIEFQIKTPEIELEMGVDTLTSEMIEKL
uniref:Biogenesis of lysosome-related organelles complex 1 subunit 3 n=1 Tax=Culicoides sonorensis TaxID=179676 RepID=A0A336LU07_CULSO